MPISQQIARTFEFAQLTPSSTWVIQHNLNQYPIIDIFVQYEGEMQKVMPVSLQYTDANSCVVQFSTPLAGIATVA